MKLCLDIHNTTLLNNFGGSLRLVWKNNNPMKISFNIIHNDNYRERWEYFRNIVL